MSRVRLNVFVEREYALRLRELATKREVSKSSIVANALATFLSADGADRREAALVRRLERLSHQFEKLERDQNILIEAIALYVRYFLSVSAPVPDAHQDAARAQGRARFDQFVQQLGRHLQRGGSLIRDVHREVFPDRADPSDGGEASTSVTEEHP